MISIFYNQLNHPLIDLIIIFILLSGLYSIGSQLIDIFKLNNIIRSVSELKYQKIIISVNFIILILYPLILYFENADKILLLTFCIIFLFGSFNVLKKISSIKIKSFKQNLYEKDFSKILFNLIIIFLILLSLSPVTSADSLAYHLYVGKYLLEIGSFPVSILFPHLRTIGSGELLIGLGLVGNVEQFNSVLQMIGLIGLIGIIKETKPRFYIQLLLISSPIIIFFISTIKPQLLHIASNGLIFSIILKDLYKQKENIYTSRNIIFFIIVIITSINVKFSFILSGFLILLIILLQVIKRKILIKFFFLCFILFFFFYFPTLFWKWVTYGGDFIELIYSPFTTDLNGMDNFKSMLINHGNEKPIYWLFFPLHYKEITQTLGLGSFLFFVLFFNIKRNILGIIIISLFIFTGFYFGQKQPRFFFEVYFWIIFLICLNNESVLNKNIFKALVIIQSMLFFIITSYGVLTLSKGLISKEMEKHVLRNHADGFMIFEWANSILKNNNEPVLYFHRSISLAKNKAISPNFLYYVDLNDPLTEIYFRKLRKIQPKYALVYKKPDLEKYKNCFIGLLDKKEKVGFHATRNPLAKGNIYDGYIYKIDVELFPDCIEKKK